LRNRFAGLRNPGCGSIEITHTNNTLLFSSSKAPKAPIEPVPAGAD